MKLSPLVLAGAVLTACALFNSGCVTDETAAAPVTATNMGAPPEGVNTVRMTVDGTGPEAAVSLNGFMVGYTPREIHLEVTPDGRLAYDVTISIAYKQGATRQMAPGASTAQAQPGSYTYRAGDRVPAMLEILGANNKHESRNLASWDTKPTVPSARHE